MKKLFFSCIFGIAALSLLGAEPQTGLRVDISGLAKGISVQITAATDSQYAAKASWLKEKNSQYAFMYFPFSLEWKKVDFSFITDIDGDVTVIFQTNIPADKDNAWIYIKDISIRQKDDKKITLALNDGLWNFQKTQDNKYKGELLKSENVFKAAYLSGVSRVVQVKGGEETMITVWYKTGK